MAIPELNEDVVTIICDFLINVPDLCAISLTCSSFRPIAIRRLLSMRPIRLIGGASVRQFHTFLFADSPARAPFVHALELDTGSVHRPPQPGDASLLVDILTSCQRIEHITFARRPFTQPLTEDPGVIDAIASIPSLRSLSIQSTAAHALALVHKVRTPLRALGLWCFYAGGSEDDEFNWYPTAFQDTLSHLAPSLKKLSFHELVVDPDIIQELWGSDAEGAMPPISSWTQYPAVRSLSVNYFTGMLLLEPLQHLFPALDGTLSVGQIDVGYPEDTLADMRAANQRAQEGENGSDSGAWRKLDRVVCTPVAFYLLCLRCPVRLAIIDGTDGYYGLEVVQRCVAVSLRENPVPRLTLCLTLEDGLGVLYGLPPPELGDTLAHLALVLDAAGRGPFGWNELLDAIIASLQPLHKLAHLRIVIQSNRPAAENIDRDTETDPGVSVLHPPAFDLQGTATLLLRQLPSLQSLFLTACGYFTHCEEVTNERWCISGAWRVAVPTSLSAYYEEGDGKCTRMLVELLHEEAEAVIQREELVIPDAYKVWFT